MGSVSQFSIFMAWSRFIIGNIVILLMYGLQDRLIHISPFSLTTETPHDKLVIH